MEETILILPALITFFSALLILPKWINKCKQIGLVWEDMNKPGHPKNVASSGGIVVVMAFTLGVLSYLAFRTFFRAQTEINIQIFSLLTTILIFAIVGLTDDLLGWKHGGLSKRLRVGLAVLGAVPLMVINAGNSTMNFPLLGSIHLGLFYPLFLIPLGIAGASTTFNFLAGFNGLEAGQGILMISFLSYVAYLQGVPWLTFIGALMVISLLVFYFYNKVPAKVFPGGTLTYTVGSLIAVMAILGNMEKIAIFVFIPVILEVILKTRGRLKKHSFGIPQKDGSLKVPYPKIYGLTHLSIFVLSKFKTKVYEKDVTYLIFAFQLLIIFLAWI